MFKRMKLGTKIAVGFGSLILIALVLGGMAVWRMWGVEEQSSKLAQEYVPEVGVANRVERNALLTMYEIRGYGLAEEQAYLTRGEKYLGEVTKSLEDAKALADKSPHLVRLKSEVGDIQTRVGEYHKLIQETESKNKALEENRHALDLAAAEYMKSCNAFVQNQTEAMKSELTGGENTTPGSAPGEVAAARKTSSAGPITASPCPAADQVVELLKQGNKRYTDGQSTKSHLDQGRRAETASQGQHPQATVLACSDSRVPVEAIFDLGIGDVFPVRVAGNVCGVDELGTIEYGVEHLETPLLIVMGHTKCGAVTAVATGAEVRGSIAVLAENIRPAVTKIKSASSQLTGDALVDACVTENTWRSIEQLLTHSQAVQERAKAGKVKIVGAIYHIADGTVEWLGAHPRQGELLAAVVEAPEAKGRPGEALTADAAAKKIERLTKITMANEIIDLGNATRIACFKSQALREPKLIEAAGKNFDEMKIKFDALRKITRQQVNIEQIDRTMQAAESYKAAMNSLLANWTALQELAKKRGETGDQVLKDAQSTSQAGLDNTAQIAGEAMQSLSTASLVMIIGLSVALLLGCSLAFTITRSITKPVKRIIAGLTDGANQVNDAAGQVSTAAQELAEGASEQASSLEETSSALEEMAAMTRTNAANAKEADQLASQTRQAANEGDKSMVQLNGAMTNINESSEKISKIIKVIEEIAFQTNLLALNAAVEAARAGEHGKGFAVVADEVRNLAQRAAQAAKETTSLIEDAVHNAQEGTQVATGVGKALAEIVGQATKVSELINGISRASDEQAQGVDQVNIAVSQMDKVTQQTASSAEESAAASEELAAQAQAVKSMVNELVAMVGGAQGQSTPAPSSSLKPRSPSRRAPVVLRPSAGKTSTAPKHPAEHLNKESTLDLDSF